MIKINLATRKQAATVSAEGRGTASASLSGLLSGVRTEGLKELPLKKLGLMVVAGALGTYLLNDHKEGELARQNQLLAGVRAEQTKLKTELAKTKGFDQLKSALDADEQMLKTKIDTIQTLLNGRQTPHRMMFALSTTIPADAWLRSVKISGEEVSLSGASLGFNAISDFMKGLGESAYFADVKLQSTQQERDESGAEVAGFQLSARRR